MCVDLTLAATSLYSVAAAVHHQSCPRPGFWWCQPDPPDGSWRLQHLDDLDVPAAAADCLRGRARTWAPCQICSSYPPEKLTLLINLCLTVITG